MKKIMMLIASVAFLAGCGTTYSSTQVGPDRYVHTAHGKDINNSTYTAILQNAYTECKSASYPDYSIARTMNEQDSLIVYVQCEKEQLSPAATDARDNPNDAIADMKRLYEAAKKKVEEKLNVN